MGVEGSLTIRKGTVTTVLEETGYFTRLTVL